jgi:hypothetical protein
MNIEKLPRKELPIERPYPSIDGEIRRLIDKVNEIIDLLSEKEEVKEPRQEKVIHKEKDCYCDDCRKQREHNPRQECECQKMEEGDIISTKNGKCTECGQHPKRKSHPQAEKEELDVEEFLVNLKIDLELLRDKSGEGREVYTDILKLIRSIKSAIRALTP